MEIAKKENRPVLVAVQKAHKVCFEAEDGSMKMDWGKFSDPMIQNGLGIMKIINKYGYEAFVVGGIVRDMLMGDAKPDDFDIATNMPTEEVQKIFNKGGFKTIDIGGERFATVVVNYKGVNYDVAHYRTEAGYSDNRRPDIVKIVQTFEEDSSRRDLTINAMGADAEGNVRDFWGGQKDIVGKKIRTVGEPEERFEEDYLRMIRAIRFAARFDFDIDEKTLNAIKKLKGKLVNSDNPVSTNRIKAEMTKMMKYGGKFATMLKFLRELEIFPLILPEIELTDEKIEAVERANSKDSKVNFAILLRGMDKDQITGLKERFKLTSEEASAANFVNIYMKTYHMLDKLDKEKAYYLMVGKHRDDKNKIYFPLMRKVHVAFNGNDIPNANEIVNEILSYGKIISRKAEISELMQKKGVATGPEYGKIKNEITSWLVQEFANGTEPSREQVSSKIDELAKGS